MIKAYVSSVLIYCVILVAEAIFFRDSIHEKGWIEGPVDTPIHYDAVIILACIPILRFICAIVFVIMGMFTKDEVKRW